MYDLPEIAVVKEKKQWTIIFIVILPNDSSGKFNLILRSIVDNLAHYNSEVNVVFCIKGTADDLSKIELKEGVTLGINPGKKLTTVFLLNDQFIAECKKFDLTIVGPLIFFIRNIVLKGAPARKYAFFTWEHGQAYAIFDEKNLPESDTEFFIEGAKEDDFKKGLFRLIFSSYKKNRYSKFISGKASFSRKDRFPKLLTMAELQFTIARTLKKVEIVALANCRMQLIDTGFAFKKVTKLLVACEGLIQYNTFNFGCFLQKMGQKEKVTNKEFVDFLYDSIDVDDKCSEDKTKSKDLGGLFTNRVTIYPQLVNLVNRLSRILIKLIRKGDFELIYAVRRKCVPITDSTNYHLVDFFSFCKELLKSIQTSHVHPRLLAVLKEILAIRRKIVMKKKIGDNFNNPNSKLKLKGLSIFFPLNDLLIDNNFWFVKMSSGQSNIKSRFVRHNVWDNFIAVYLKETKTQSKTDTESFAIS